MTIRSSIYVASSALLIWLGAYTGLAHAQTVQTPAVCGKRGVIAQKLHQEYAEAPIGAGLASSGYLVEIFASSGGTWTIVITQPGGTACLVASGSNWEGVPEIAQDSGV